MTNHTPDELRPVQAPSRLYADDAATGTRTSGQSRALIEKIEQTRALAALTAGMETVVYAFQFPDGTVKIGCTSNLGARLRCFRASGAVVVGFRAGGFPDEAEIHAALRPHRSRGREYYHPAPEVMAVVNDMRDHFNLPPLAA